MFMLGLNEALKQVDRTTTEDYLLAVKSQRNEETPFKPVLIASALAEPDGAGSFNERERRALIATPLPSP